MRNQRPPQPLRIMILQNMQHAPRNRQTGLPLGTTIPEIDQQRQRLLPGGRNIQRPLQHVHQMLHLLGPRLGVLVLREQVQARPALLVEAEQDLLPRGIFVRDIVGGEAGGAVFAPPDEGFLDAADGVGDVPFCCAQVAEETFAG